MKRLLFLLALTVLSGCQFIDPGLSPDPNRPASVGLSQILPSAQLAFAYAQGGVLSRYTTVWMQQAASFERESTPIDRYLVLEADMDYLWSAYYAQILQDLRVIRTQAEETSSPHYAGISKILEAMVMSQIADLWSDAPYSEALKGAANLHPAYDSGEAIYESLQALLGQAIQDLNEPAGAYRPGADDLIYGGDAGAWQNLARMWKSRLYLHRSQYDKALAELDAGGLSSNAQNAMVFFGEAENEQNPWYQYDFQRGDIGLCSVFTDLLAGLEDPRLAVLATTDETGGYSGNPPGEGNDPFVSKVGDYYASAASPVPLALYPEQLFLEAEAALISDPARAAQAFNRGVEASLAMFGVASADYLAAYGSETAASITLEKIMTQKYIALFTMPEAFTDWRRTAFPELSPVEGHSQLPRRFPYPPMEKTYNAEHYPGDVTVFERVFWDE